MDYKDSSAFSSGTVDKVNNYAEQLDKKLYVFAYYSPKQYEHIEWLDAREKFWIAVTNLYALYHDCNPFLKSMYSIFYKNDQRIRGIIPFHNLLGDLRGMYCHNSSKDDNANVVVNVFGLINSLSNGTFPLPQNTAFRDANLLFSNTEWDVALKFICDTSDDIIKVIQTRLQNLDNSPDKQTFICLMRKRIAKWTVSDYTQKWSFFEEYANNAQLNVVGSRRNLIKSNWDSDASRDNLGKCMEDLLSPTSSEITEPAFPQLLLAKAFPKCNPVKYDCYGSQIQPLQYSVTT